MTVLPIVAREADADSLRVSLDIREELDWVDGHFSKMSVLAGVVQLHWAVILAKEHFGMRGEPLDIQRLKFKSVVIPPIVVEMTLTRTGPTDVQFVCTSPGRQHSEGRLRFPENAG